MVFPYTQRTWVCEKINPELVGNYRSLNSVVPLYIFQYFQKNSGSNIRKQQISRSSYYISFFFEKLPQTLDNIKIWTIWR
jgi:hypothetical protein